MRTVRSFLHGVRRCARQRRASVLVIVLWIAFGLVSIALYFGQSMIFNLQAADNYQAGVESEQAIEGAARYINYVLTNLQVQAQTPCVVLPGTIRAYSAESGQTPYDQTYQGEEVTVGEARFWLIGRDVTGRTTPSSGVPVFSLVDESSKLNINTATLEMIEALPYMTSEWAASILNWRNAAGTASQGGADDLQYALLNPPYYCKHAAFETIDELKFVMGSTTDVLYGADLNLNGILDQNENSQNSFQTGGGNLDGGLNAGILEYVTIYSREPNTQADGSARVNVNSGGQGGQGAQSGLQTLLQDTLGAQRATQIMQQAGLGAAPEAAPEGGQGTTTFGSVLEFYVRSGMTADEFAQVADGLTATNAETIAGLVNVNSAPAPVLACLPGIGVDNAQALVAYRQTHQDQLMTVAWVTQVLEQDAAIRAGPYITTKSYQFTADVAAVGHYGRGYRRTVFVFDTSSGTPQIIYRRDMNQLNWALGNVREKWQLTRNMP